MGLTPIVGPPGLRGHLHCLGLERLRGIAGHGVKAPHGLARPGIECIDIAALVASVDAVVADEDLAVPDTRRLRDAVLLAAVAGNRLPNLFTGLAIDREQPA